ncbi:MAG: HD domain-containing protein [Bradymonadales bacterium]|nr:HD domain-containing protein [Bradymonadales bacterium]
MQGHYNLKVADLARTMSQVGDAAEGKHLGHAQAVAHLSYALGRQQALSAGESQALLLAGMFHDIGWVLLAPEVARIAGGMDSSPLRQHPCGKTSVSSGLWPLLEAHAGVGADFLAPLALPEEAVRIIRHSHEAWDGTGSPDRLAGDEIPLGAQMVAVADHAVSLLDPFLGEEELPGGALEGLEGYAGSRLNPEGIALVRQLLTEPGGWARIASTDAIEPLVDEALYPLFGDFIEPTSPISELWVELIGELADRYHPRVRRHSFKVKAYAGTIARSLGLGEPEVREIQMAAQLAEVGRAGLPLPLVFRAGPYTEEEWELLRAYPTVAERILAPIRSVKPIFQAAITHREKLDGSGYPEGLMGQEIPLGGRIICVADVYVALRHHDFRRPAYSQQDSLAIIQSQETRLFDGLVVDALEAVVPGLEEEI